jgi:hypothetical protein
MDLQTVQDKYQRLMGPLPTKAILKAHQRAGAVQAPTSERGFRATPENQVKYLYRQMWTDPELRATVLDIRHMDRMDPRVKKVHNKTANAIIKGGLRLKNSDQSPSIRRAWDKFQRRLSLNRRPKLHSDARGLMMEGNLPMQWVLDEARRTLLQGVRMPSETIIPKVGQNGRFVDPRSAYEQYDLTSGTELYTFALWQLTMGRLTPDNWDDFGSLGRAYLDASRSIWRKLVMTEEDIVIRRRTRAPLRMAHVMEGVSETELEKYKNQVEADQAEGNTNDYYMNKKGSVTALQGDANLEQIADVVHLLDTFFAGSPAPKGLFGYTGNLNRDILEDLKRDYFEEVDAMQDELSAIYQMGFELQLLLDGVNPDNFDFTVEFAERRTETANQAADRALKWQALGASQQTVMEIIGVDANQELKRKEAEKDNWNPYPDPNNINPKRPDVSVTPGNQRKGESATTISTRSGNG